MQKVRFLLILTDRITVKLHLGILIKKVVKVGSFVYLLNLAGFFLKFFFSFLAQSSVTGESSSSIVHQCFEFILRFDPIVEVVFCWRIVSSRESEFSVHFVEFSISALAESRGCETDYWGKKKKQILKEMHDKNEFPRFFIMKVVSLAPS